MTTDHPHHENPQRDCITLDRTRAKTVSLVAFKRYVMIVEFRLHK
jgi:hypothetical protein